jgi:N6-adenosine-specific RNA methylase IME4
MNASDDLLNFIGKRKFSTILADPPWQFQNRTGKMAPEHKRLSRYSTMKLQEIKDLPVEAIAEERAHLYLWIPNALLAEGMQVMENWGFKYKTNLIWYKIRKDGGPDRRGVGFYFRNVTEMILFGVRGKNIRTLQPGRSQENIISSRKREHSRGWITWGKQSEVYTPDWATYSNHSQTLNVLRFRVFSLVSG